MDFTATAHLPSIQYVNYHPGKLDKVDLTGCILESNHDQPADCQFSKPSDSWIFSSEVLERCSDLLTYWGWDVNEAGENVRELWNEGRQGVVRSDITMYAIWPVMVTSAM